MCVFLDFLDLLDSAPLRSAPDEQERHRAQTFAAITTRCSTKSTWSIDLAYLLHGYGLDTRYFTITWGANESYKSIEYYKENLDRWAKP